MANITIKDIKALEAKAFIPKDSHPDNDETVIWAVDSSLISREKFEINGLVIDPAVDMLCIGSDEMKPNLDRGAWTVTREVFADTYVLLDKE